MHGSLTLSSSSKLGPSSASTILQGSACPSPHVSMVCPLTGMCTCCHWLGFLASNHLPCSHPCLSISALWISNAFCTTILCFAPKSESEVVFYHCFSIFSHVEYSVVDGMLVVIILMYKLGYFL